LAKNVIVLIGTTKGAFLAKGDAKRRSWEISGPLCNGWPLNHVIADEASGAIYAGGGNGWFGDDVWKSTDLGETWTRSGEGLAYEEGAAEPVQAVWSLAPRNGDLYAGVKPAGLFKSSDGGRSWQHVEGLQEHPTRPEWRGGGAGLILHSIALDPTDENQIWVGMSAVGVFHSGDGGKTWEPRNSGTRADFMPEGQRYPVFGQCVHCLVRAPESGRLYQQNHCGMYRSDDGGRTWESIEAGLPSSFGFPAAVHPRDARTLFLLPLNGVEAGRFPPDGKAAVWRTRDGGDTWEARREGLPQENAFFAVLRQAMATDRLDPAGVYFGTNSGSLFASADEGDSWQEIAQHLPTILSVETLVVDA
jgi:photosystem II stability/assembly factor-like uncharacterized protein